jgi:hypothetical protein
MTEFEGRGDEIHVLPAVALMATDEQKTNYLTTQLNNLYLKDIITYQSEKTVSNF